MVICKQQYIYNNSFLNSSHPIEERRVEIELHENNKFYNNINYKHTNLGDIQPENTLDMEKEENNKKNWEINTNIDKKNENIGDNIDNGSEKDMFNKEREFEEKDNDNIINNDELILDDEERKKSKEESINDNIQGMTEKNY